MPTERDFSVKGAPKFFFKEENIDRLFAMVMGLGAEVSALGEKLDTVVRLLEHQQPVSRAAIAGFEPDETGRLERAAALTALVETMLAPFQEAANDLAARAAALG
jgi:hypothetical protein